MSKDFFHRVKLVGVPADGYIPVYKDSNRNAGAVPEYMPTSLITQPVGGGLSPVYGNAANQSLSGAGAVNTTSPVTFYTSTVGPDALTLADASTVGLVKTVTHVSDSGSGVLTPANFADGTTITFTNVNDTWTGIWTGTTWLTISLSGAVIA